jgi:hypothetical protein
MENYLSFELRKLLGNNTPHHIENTIDLGDQTLYTITCIKHIEDIQLEKISLFLKELFDDNTLSGFSKTESTQLIMFQLMINNKK